MDSGSADPSSNLGRTIFKGTRERGVETSDLKSIYFSNRDDFISWLQKTRSDKYAQDVFKCTDQIFKNDSITIENVKEVISQSRYSNKYSSIGFRNFLNYCLDEGLLLLEEVNLFRSKIKLNNKVSVDTYIPSFEEIKRSVNNLKENLNIDLILYKLILESGCRISELKEFLIHFDSNKVEEWDDSIIIYRNFHIRNNKSSFYLFFTKDTFNRFLQLDRANIERVFSSFINRVVRDSNVVNLKYLRKFHFSLMVEHGLSFEIANFIQGRASQNVGFNHYLAKKVIAVKEYARIIEVFKYKKMGVDYDERIKNRLDHSKLQEFEKYYVTLSKHDMIACARYFRKIRDKKFKNHSKPLYGDLSKRIIDEDFRRILEHTNEERGKMAFILMRSLGLRVSEVVTINLIDIKRDQDRIIIHNWKGKTINEMIIPISLREVLYDYLDKYDKEIEKSNGYILYKLNPGSFSQNGMNEDAVRMMFVRARKKAGIGKTYHVDENGREMNLISTHSLRYGFISSFYEKTRDIELTRIAARHCDIHTTQGYVKVDKNRVFEIMETMQI